MNRTQFTPYISHSPVSHTQWPSPNTNNSSPHSTSVLYVPAQHTHTHSQQHSSHTSQSWVSKSAVCILHTLTLIVYRVSHKNLIPNIPPCFIFLLFFRNVDIRLLLYHFYICRHLFRQTLQMLPLSEILYPFFKIQQRNIPAVTKTTAALYLSFPSHLISLKTFASVPSLYSCEILNILKEYKNKIP